jgi:serine protease Do
MLNQNHNNHKTHTIMKFSAALAAMAIVSGTSVEMYHIFGEGSNTAPVRNVSESTASASASAQDQEIHAASTASVQASNVSWVDLASPSDALSIPEIVEKAMPSAVGISSTFNYTPQNSGMNYFGYGFGGMYDAPQSQSQEVTATGSGIVMSSNGYIITNAHVIYDTESEYSMGKATSVSVVMGEDHDQEYKAEIVGYDLQTDLAVLKIDAEGLTPAEFGNSDDLQVGELVVAIGNPLGFELYGTTTCGIVSAKNREVQLDDRTMTLIQTDAAINSGNSGGMLLNAYGQVIGINSMKMGSSYSSASVEGLGFAIPISDAKEIITSLINNGYVTGRPQLGITGVTVTESDAERFNLPQGVYVYGVSEGSAAAQAGLQQGDIITAIDGVEITTMEELNEQKNQHKAGETGTLRVNRSGETRDVQMTLQEAQQEN